jgi:hypothetical protein
VETGEVEVSIDGRTDHREGAGSGFGEVALLRAIPRTATVTAVGPVGAWSIDCDTFISAMLGHEETAVLAHAVVERRLQPGGRTVDRGFAKIPKPNIGCQTTRRGLAPPAPGRLTTPGCGAASLACVTGAGAEGVDIGIIGRQHELITMPPSDQIVTVPSSAWATSFHVSARRAATKAVAGRMAG